jgi:hypothetical protein
MWVLTAPNPAIVAVYSTTCMENGLIGEKNSLETTVICSALFSSAIIAL